MKTFRCKCGESIIYSSMGTGHNCEGCTKCNTTYADHPDHHLPLEPHDWITKYNQNTGKPYKVYNKCCHRDKESYKESQNNANN